MEKVVLKLDCGKGTKWHSDYTWQLLSLSACRTAKSWNIKSSVIRTTRNQHQLYIQTKRAKHPNGWDPYYHYLYFSREPLVSQEYCSCCLIYSHERLKIFSHAKSSAPSSIVFKGFFWWPKKMILIFVLILGNCKEKWDINNISCKWFTISLKTN